MQCKTLSLNTRYQEHVKWNFAWICAITTDIRVAWDAGVE